MAGELTRGNVEAAARAAAGQAGALKKVADGFSPDPGWAETFDSYKRKLDEAGHTIGGGYDGCKVCMEMAAQLPSLMQKIMAEQQAEGGQPPAPEV